MAEGCGELEEVSFFDCLGVGDEGVAALAAGCRRLSTVHWTCLMQAPSCTGPVSL